MHFEKHEVEWNSEKVARFWNYVQENQALSQHFFGLQVGEHVARFINRKLKLKRLRRILDFSCGRGDILMACLPFLEPGQEIYGTDFSERNVAQVNARLKHVPLFREARLLRRFPSHFPDDHFDLVVATEVVEHLSDSELAQMMRETCRILRPGGFLFVSTPFDERYDAEKVICPDCGCVFHRWQHLRTWNRETLCRAIEPFGFRTVHAAPIAWASPLAKRIAVTLAAAAGLKRKNGLAYIGAKETSFCINTARR